MRLLVTGCSGTIGEGLVPHLVRGGHEVRMLSRGAQQDSREWPDHVVPFPADIADAASLLGAANGCETVIHVSGIEREAPPAETFERVNVAGTRNIVLEAQRAGVTRFIFLSSLGAQHGASAYHESKRRAEEIVRTFDGNWILLRVGNVYGPGDEVISTLLGMLRALPLLPMVDSGDQEFQPIWYDDLGAAVAKVIAMEGLSRVTLELAGEELTSTNDLLDRFSRLTGKNPPRIGVPSIFVSLLTRMAETFGVHLPIDRQKLTMLLEGNVIAETSSNGLVATLGITPIPLDDGLAVLVDIQPEQKPGDGVGSIAHKRFWADIVGARLDAGSLMDAFKSHINEIMPIDFASEPGAPTTITEGATMTAQLPLRGTVQMRVEECSPHHVTLATLRGHPIAGVVRFSAAEHASGALRFQVAVHAQAASVVDWMMLKTAGSTAQNATWKTVVERMVERSEGSAPKGVETQARTLSGEEATEAEHWISEMILERKRQTHREATTG